MTRGDASFANAKKHTFESFSILSVPAHLSSRGVWVALLLSSATLDRPHTEGRGETAGHARSHAPIGATPHHAALARPLRCRVRPRHAGTPPWR